MTNQLLRRHNRTPPSLSGSSNWISAKRAIAEYCRSNMPQLEQSYSWKIPVSFQEYNVSGDSFQANKDLRYQLHTSWKAAPYEGRLDLARRIVADWGGVRSNKQSTLKEYVRKAEAGENDWPLKGVASYSKILSVIDPSRFAIYDARVAVALIAAQHIFGDGPGLAFRYVPGRNKTTGDHLGRGFVHEPPFKQDSLLADGWCHLEQRDNYSTYLALLHSIVVDLESSTGDSATVLDVEMCLFANAENLAKEALKQT